MNNIHSHTIAWMRLLKIYNVMDMTHKPLRRLKIVITMLLFHQSTEHLTQNLPEFLQEVDPLRDSNNMGIDVYLDALTLLQPLVN